MSKNNWKLTKEEKEKVVELYLSGEIVSTLANKYDISSVAIRVILKNRDVKIRKSPSLFKKGTMPWNNGKKCPQLSGENHHMYGKHHSEETKKKISDNSWMKTRKGILPKNMRNWKMENHPRWKGGISKIDRKCRRMKEYLWWRSDVFTRDNWTCKTCGRNDCYVTAHHIKGFAKILKENNIKTIDQARECKELWNRKNGVTLCEDCHKLTDNYKGRGSK